MAERKYLNEFEMGLLKKYGIKCIKNRYDANDLLDMLPKKWKGENLCGIEITFDYGMNEWNCTTPYWVVENCSTNKVKGDTLVECLCCAVLRLAKHKAYREYLNGKYLVEDWNDF